MTLLGVDYDTEEVGSSRNELQRENNSRGNKWDCWESEVATNPLKSAPCQLNQAAQGRATETAREVLLPT